MKKILLVLLTLLMLVGCSSKQDVVVEEPKEPIGYKDPVYIVATKDSGITSLEDLSGKNLGIQTNYDKENSNFVLSELANKEIEINTVDTGSYQSIPDCIADGSIEAWIIPASMHDDGLLFNYRTDYLSENYVVVSKFEEPIYEEETVSEDISSNKLWNKPFVVMLTGLDERVDPDANNAARNDVNILLVVDPTNNHVLTISFPRDSYVYMPNFGYSCKLTEVGVRASGEEEIRNAIGDALDIEIPYFVQVSFSSFVDMIDSLGGVTIDVPYDVYMDQDSNRNVAQPYEMDAGEKNVRGEWALALARNRKYAGIYNGDYGRIRNQCLIVNSIFEKIANHPYLLNWAGWTWMAPYLAYYNFDDAELKTLFALADKFSKGYTVDNYFIENIGGTSPSGASIGYMQEDSIEIAKGKIELVMNGTSDKNNPYYDDIFTGLVTGGANTTGYVGETYDLHKIYK